jgi:choline dehydrogenase-like flavoprotein
LIEAERGLERVASGAKEVWSARGLIPTSHLMDGTIMGTGPDDSVVNSYGQSHEIPNLWVAGVLPLF